MHKGVGIVKSLSDKIKQNLEVIQKKVDPYRAKIIAVTKYYSKEAMIEAYKTGLRDFGESRAVEAYDKINSIEDEVKNGSTYHFIGHLQTNKVKHVVGLFEYIHSVDSINLVKCLDEVSLKLGLKQKVLIQVNNAGEEQKFGIAPFQLNSFLNEIQKFENIEVVGLMNIAPLTDDWKMIRKLFHEMFQMKESFGLKELSMGMSRDFEIALDEGATMIRLGKMIFE